MGCAMRIAVVVCGSLALSLDDCGPVVGSEPPKDPAERPADGVELKTPLGTSPTARNLLSPEAWRSWHDGYERENDWFVCDNGEDSQSQRGASQTVVLNQTQIEPIVATAYSKAEGVTGSPDANYSLYLDLVYTDGTPLWGQIAPFSTGSHDWQRRQVVVVPEKPVRQVSFYMLLRSHGGKAWFRAPQLYAIPTPVGACLFDGTPIMLHNARHEGFQVRDVAAGSAYVRIDRQALGLTLDWQASEQQGDTFIDATLSDTTGRDRAVSLVYAIPVPREGLRWCHDPRQTQPVEGRREYMNAGSFRVAGGRLSRYPLAAVTTGQRGTALGIDMAQPAFFRIGYNSGTEELFITYDLGLTAEKPTARIRFCRFSFDPKWEFRSALARYYEIFPDAFRCRTPEQGMWMPFARISRVEGWQDFGFKFKEGTNETGWDDEQGITTFRYTEPMTWWMRMPPEMPRSLEAAWSEARRRAEQKDDLQARALMTSAYHNEDGQPPARLLDTPWCNGAVWSMNSMPGVSGDVTDFSNKWNKELRERLYGPGRKADLDGEYIDSSEGYVTDELNFRRDHFAVAQTPLTFSQQSHRPAIFRGLIAFEYVRGIARDVHARDKLMMANSTPIRLCWLAPLLDVMGTETNWNPGGTWRPMSDTDLLYRRAMCKGKPYCFLMNTRFEDFSHVLVERYMKQALAYGMFPGFFSHNASQGHYFTRPELYNRDRPLFKRYVPLCRVVAEAGWQPITRARSPNDQVHVERFGNRYLTVLNNGPDRCTAELTVEFPVPPTSYELVGGSEVRWKDGKTTITLDSEDVAVLDVLGDPKP